MQIAVIDDWPNVASRVLDWTALDPIGEFSFLHDYPADRATLQKRLGAFAVICVMRERTLQDLGGVRRLFFSQMIDDTQAWVKGPPIRPLN